MKIKCDTSGCTNEAEWKDKKGNRWCDSCKRDIVAYEKEINLHEGKKSVFTREKRV